MHCQALVFGDQPEILMDSLIQTSSMPVADVWVPLDVTGGDGRSSWHTVSSGYRQFTDPSDFSYGTWVHCVWPTFFLREHLGPHALLSQDALSALEVSRDAIRKKHGEWWAHIPRFFETIGVHWSMQYGSTRWHGRDSADAADGATVGSLDLEYNLTTHDPNLIVEPRGPVFYHRPDGDDSDVATRRRDASLPLMDLPRSTPVTLVTWHDQADRGPYGPRSDSCSCFDSYYEPYRRPYDASASFAW